MPAKTPIYLKTSTPRRGRKLRLRDVLSSDMISPPLGDFRHSAHIGPGGEGDMFGELSFLQGRRDLLPGGSPGGGDEEEAAFGRCPAASGCRRALLKSAVSLPVFSAAPQGQDQAAPPKPPRLYLAEMTPGGRGGRRQQQQQRSMSVSCAEGCFCSSAQGGLPFCARAHCDPTLPSSASFSARPPEGAFAAGSNGSRVDSRECSSSYACGGTAPPRSESLLRLDLDLGPSILDDVLRIMEEHRRPAAAAAAAAAPQAL